MGKSPDRDHLVRLFFGWGNSVVWFSGDLPYEEVPLAPDLIAELKAWELSFPNADEVMRPPTPESRQRDTERSRVGERLARRVADAIGDDFVVEYNDRLFRARGLPHDRDAAQGFERLAAANRQERSEWDATVGKLRGGGAWYAYGPGGPRNGED